MLALADIYLNDLSAFIIAEIENGKPSKEKQEDSYFNLMEKPKHYRDTTNDDSNFLVNRAIA